jgi:polysaccharide export outer membrane protein
MKANNKFLRVLTVVLLILEVSQVRVGAQLSTNYRVKAGDKLYIQVPQRSDLSRDLVVQNNGLVNIPLVGDIEVAGLTVQEIKEKVFQALKDLYPSITQVEVTISEAISQVVYVIGQVGNPGRYTFSASPNLWEAIREAGGPTPEAALDNVRIVKDRSRGGASITVNVQEALENGTVDELPDLENSDTVIITQRAQTYTGPLGVSVFGAVENPGAYRLEGRKDLVSAILLAGGPNDIASLKSIKIIRLQSDGTTRTIEVDLRNFLEEGDPLANPELMAMDTVNVPERNRFLQSMTTGGFVLGLVTAGVGITTLILTARN